MTDSLFAPPDWLEREEEVLAPYAMRTRQSRGRRHPQDPHPFRTLYQRDRDRIVHSTAFRRLMYKTQVLAAPTNDHHRTRLTHTLEVAQISRTVARQLGLNEDLTEAIALAHDLGHPPFGHAGEETLNECMRDHGGFEHNLHGLRIVELLEYRYPHHPGLNLSWEVLESLALRSGQRQAAEIADFTAAGQPLLEAQVVDVTDSLAYDTHDVDDALSTGLITTDELADVSFWSRAAARIRERHPSIGSLQFQPAVIRALIDWQVSDLLRETRRRLAEQKIRTVEDVRRAKGLIVRPSPEVQGLKEELEEFLWRKVYSHYRVLRMAAKGRRCLGSLFAVFRKSSQLLPARYAERARTGTPERTICDYLAGMTDRYAREEFQRLFQADHEV
jgi:dGTPase